MHHITQDITNKWVNFLFPILIHLVIAWNDVNPSKNAWYSLRKISDATFPPHITSKFERVRQNNRSITCADVQPKHSNLNLNPFCRSCVITCGLKVCKLFDARHRVKKQFQTYTIVAHGGWVILCTLLYRPKLFRNPLIEGPGTIFGW